MAVKRIVANITSPDVRAGQSFYGDLLGMEVVMDHDWIITYAGEGEHRPQISIASKGGSGTHVPDLSIEVDNLDEILARVKAANIPLVYGPAEEAWGVRRFYIRDPFGKLVNIVQHL